MKNWINSTVIYEVNLRQYTPEGTIAAFAAHLPRLQHLGVETLWFMPITPISQKDKKGTLGSYYACADYTSVSTEFGTLDDFKTLVQTAHSMGFKVILDWVANHTGCDHWWTVQHPEWYKKDEQTGDFKKASGMDDIIELDHDNAEMRAAIVAAMRFWVEETGIDGFRCDLAFWVPLHFWVEAKQAIDAVAPLFWLAEMDPLEHPDYMQVFDAAYAWGWMHKTEAFCKGEAPFSDLWQLLQQYTAAPGLQAWFTTNHDENTWNGTEYEKYGALAIPLAVFSLTWPGVPLMYSGQEMPNHKRLAFFEKDIIEWKGHDDLHTFYRTLHLLKKSHGALSATAKMELLVTDTSSKLLVYRRFADDGAVLVLLNFSGADAELNLPELNYNGWQNIFTAQPYAIAYNGPVRLAANEAVVLVQL